MGPAFGPLHLLTLGEALADDRIHRGLCQTRGDSLAGAVPLAVVDQAVGVACDVDGELMRRTGKLAEMRVVQFQPGDIVLEELDLLSGAMLVAMPEQPFDALE